MAFELPALPYDKAGLAPHMSAETLEFHHGKHHQAYVTALNNFVKDKPELQGKSLDDIVKMSYGKPDMAAVFNNAGQHWNHILFWNCMKPKGGGALPGRLEQKIVADFGGLAQFKDAFKTAGATQFGSGWCWLVVGKDGKLKVSKTPNGENPLAQTGETAILGCDVWEHSYYIDYRNRRPDYLTAFVENLVNWEYVDSLLAKA